MVLHSSRVKCALAGLASLAVALTCAACQPVSTAADAVDTQAMVESAVAGAGLDVKDVAAVVGGRVITHQDVDDALEARRVREGLQDDAAWERYLASSGTTEADERAAVLKDMVDDVLVSIKADELGVDISAEVDRRMADVEGLYPTHAAFVSAITSKGYTEASYRDAVYRALLSDALQGLVIEPPAPTQEQVRQYAVVVAPMLVGRRSSEILVSGDDYELAVRLKQELDAGADFAQLASEYSIDSTAAYGGDAGWDSLNTFIAPYQNALSGLEVGEVSDVVRSRFGYYIIKCTDRYDAPLDADGNVDIDAIPADLMGWIMDSMSHTLASQMFDVYVGNLEATVPIAVFDEAGNQIEPAQVGLETEKTEVPSDVDDIMASAQDDVQKAAEEGVSTIKELADGNAVSSGAADGQSVSAAALAQ